MKLSILSTIGTNVEGVMTSSKLGNADIPLDKNVSICHGSNVHIVGHYRGNSKAVSYTIDGRVAGDGNSFAGGFIYFVLFSAITISFSYYSLPPASRFLLSTFPIYLLHILFCISCSFLHHSIFHWFSSSSIISSLSTF